MSVGSGLIGMLFLGLALIWSPLGVLVVLLVGFTGFALVDLIGVGGCRFFGRKR